MLATLQQEALHRPKKNFSRAFPSVMLALSLGMGFILSSGCVAIPAVMATSATVTTAALVTEGEKLVQTRIWGIPS